MPFTMLIRMMNFFFFFFPVICGNFILNLINIDYNIGNINNNKNSNIKFNIIMM